VPAGESARRLAELACDPEAGESWAIVRSHVEQLPDEAGWDLRLVVRDAVGEALAERLAAHGCEVCDTLERTYFRIDQEACMAHLRPSADVRPVTELRSHASAAIEQVQESKRPVILTQHGLSAAVLLDVAVYEALIDEVALVCDVRTAEAQLDEAVAYIDADDPAAALPGFLDQASVDVLVQDA